jgi:SsrA-binding protein
VGDIANNRRALHEYFILERFEAGVALRGTEIKSIRLGHANLNHAFARVENGEAFLYGADIQPYERASHEQHDPKRSRKLLLNRREIDRLFAQASVKGCTLVALRLYWKNGKVKLELGVGKGKELHDRRDALKAKTTKRETDREISRFNRR